MKTSTTQTNNDSLTTTFLPLTTAWPAVTECSDNYVIEIISNSIAQVYAYDRLIGNLTTDISCLPPEVTLSDYQTTPRPQFTTTVLGPIVCPRDFTTASTTILTSSTTGVICCPTKYTFDKSDFFCSSAATAGQRIVGWRARHESSFTESDTDSANATAMNSTTTLDMNTISLSISSTYYDSISTQLDSAVHVVAQPVIGYNWEREEPIVERQGLSTGVKAGIGLGVGLSVAVGFLVALWFWRRRKQQLTKAKVGSNESTLHSTEGYKIVNVPDASLDKVEVQGSDGYKEMPGHNMDGPFLKGNDRATERVVHEIGSGEAIDYGARR